MISMHATRLTATGTGNAFRTSGTVSFGAALRAYPSAC